MTARGRCRLLIVSRELDVLRGHYENVMVALAERGVEVSVRYKQEGLLRPDDFGEMLRARGADVALTQIPWARMEAPEQFILRLRQLASLLRFYHPDFRDRSWFREAKFDMSSRALRRWARGLQHVGGRRTALLGIRVVGAVDRVVPPARAAQALVAAERADAVAAVGVIRAPEFVEYLKAAARDGIPTASWVQSWDNLSSKGLLHFTADRVFVWNATQRDELARYHDVPPDHVCVTGAQTFDHWFDGSSPVTRADFCRRYGFEPERPIILYLASSRLAESSPEDFFVSWLRAVRSSSDPTLEGASVLARPHPTAEQPWLELDVDDRRTVVSTQAAFSGINSSEFRDRFRDELYHATVAVGINTSAMIDAAIFGKPVCTVELPELAHGQRGLVHFEYLSTVGGGLLRSAPSLDEHVATLRKLVRRDPYAQDERSLRFVEEFIRPHGVDVAPAAVFADEMVRLLGQSSPAQVPGPVGRSAGRLIGWAAPLLIGPLDDRPVIRPLLRRRQKWLVRHGRTFRLESKRAMKRTRRRFRRAPRAVGRRASRLAARFHA